MQEKLRDLQSHEERIEAEENFAHVFNYLSLPK